MNSSINFNSFKNTIFSIVTIFVLSLSHSGCKETTEPNNSYSDNLFTANFTNSWLCSDCGEGIIVISDTSGNVIADSTWFGNSQIKFLKSELDSVPIRISVTVIYRRANWDEKYIFIASYLNIPVGSSWTFKGLPVRDSVGTAILNFKNIPSHDEYIISTLDNLSYSNWNLLDSSMIVKMNRNPDNCYIKLNTPNNSSNYIWLSEIYNGTNYNIDLIDSKITNKKNINFPNGQSYYSELHGFLLPADHYNGHYYLDIVSGNDSMHNSIELNYPDSIFTDFETSMFLNDYNTQWYHKIYGEIPGSFYKADANFTILNAIQDSFKIEATGICDCIYSGWYQNVNNNTYIINWGVYSSPEFYSYSLPQLPGLVKEKFPFIDREEFEMFWVSMTDYTSISSFKDFLDAEFNSDEYFYNFINEVKQVGKFNIGNNNNVINDFRNLNTNNEGIPFYRID